MHGASGSEDPVRLQSVDLTDDALSGADCVVVLVGHSAIDYARVVNQARLVFDTVNATQTSNADVVRL